MKKLIVLSLILAMAASAAFAMDVGGTINTHVNVLQGNTAKDKAGDTSPVTGMGQIDRARLDGSGSNDAGTFGVYVRANKESWSGFGITGNAWWKPLDVLKIQLGGNGGDGFLAKEGITAWMFYQTVSDSGVTNPGNAWGGGYAVGDGMGYDGYGDDPNYINFRKAFYGGGRDGAEDLYLFITPMEMFSVNLQIPFMSSAYAEAADIFMRSIVQVDLNLSFGNIALTYAGGVGYKKKDAKIISTYNPTSGAKDATYHWVAYDKTTGVAATAVTDPANVEWKWEEDDPEDVGSPAWEREAVGGSETVDPSRLFLYAGINAIENLGIDFGLGYTLPYTKEAMNDDKTRVASETKVTQPIFVGLGLKYTAGQFGVKFRAVAGFAGSETTSYTNGAAGDKTEYGIALLADVLPFFAISDSLTAFASIGVAYAAPNKYSKAGVSVDKPKAQNQIGWHFNPYITVGEEWGPKFIAGIRVWSAGTMDKEKDAVTNWAVPIAIMCSF